MTSDNFDPSDIFGFSSNDKGPKVCKNSSTVSTSDFILILLFIFLAVAVGCIVQNRYF